MLQGCFLVAEVQDISAVGQELQIQMELCLSECMRPDHLALYIVERQVGRKGEICREMHLELSIRKLGDAQSIVLR